MPDRRQHRGAHPQDAEQFAERHWPDLRTAAADYCWLLSRGYPAAASLKLVGDRFAFTQRQRLAIGRYACSDARRQQRADCQLSRGQLAGQTVEIDGYNLLTTIEAALGGGVILPGRDGSTRDMASLHGSWRKVEETRTALELIGQALQTLGVTVAVWYLDSPVSNSGRLKTLLRELAEQHGWPWTVELVPNPDAVLRESSHPCITADSEILDRCTGWINLATWIIADRIPDAWVVNLGVG